MKYKNIKNKILSLILIITLALPSMMILTGCGEFSIINISPYFNNILDKDNESNLDTITGRMALNKKVAENLYTNGFISEELRNSIINNIDNIQDSIGYIHNQLNTTIRVKNEKSIGDDDFVRVYPGLYTANNINGIDENSALKLNIWKCTSALRIIGYSGDSTIPSDKLKVTDNNIFYFGSIAKSVDYCIDWKEKKQENWYDNVHENNKGTEDNLALSTIILSNSLIQNVTMLNNPSGYSSGYSISEEASEIAEATMGKWIVPKAYKEDVPITIDGIAVYNKDSNVNLDSDWIQKYYEKDTEAYKVIPTEVQDELQKVLEYPIYTLKADISERDLAKISDSIKGILSKDTDFTSDDFEIINQYFTTAIDSETGKTLTLAKIADDAGIDYYQNIVCETKFNTTCNNKQGYDYILKSEVQYSDNDTAVLDTVTLRFQEFNPNFIDNFTTALGFFNSDTTSGKYKVIKAGKAGGNRILLLEYPISTIESLSVVNDEEIEIDSGHTLCGTITKANINSSNSSMGINILNGKLLKYRLGTDGKYTKEAVYLNDDTADNVYLTTGIGDNKDDNGGSSFIVCGYNKITMTYNCNTAVKKNPPEVVTIRIVLRDYLEASWLPSFDSTGENSVVICGRKIRFSTTDIKESSTEYTNIRGEYINGGVFARKQLYQRDIYYATGSKEGGSLLKDYAIGNYTDYRGNTLSRGIALTDICDIELLNRTSYKASDDNKVIALVKSIAPYGEVTSHMSIGDNFESALPDVDELERYWITSKSPKSDRNITFSIAFPGNKIGKDDYETFNNTISNGKTRFYCVAVNVNMIDSGLFNWINSSSDNASLDWWNKYLEKYKFNYRVNHKSLNTYLQTNYVRQMQESGLVLIDLDTVVDIQNMYNKEDDQARIDAIRTTFVIIGWVIITLSVILMLLWILDTSTDLGLGLLEKVTFGHWVAVKDDTDLPNSNDNKKYMSAQKMVIKCIVLIAIGIVLINVNIMNLVMMLVDTIGRIAGYVQKAFTK